MDRFFNWNEISVPGSQFHNLDAKQFDFSNFVVEEKEDGHLMTLFNYKDKWYLNSRSYFLDQDKPD